MHVTDVHSGHHCTHIMANISCLLLILLAILGSAASQKKKETTGDATVSGNKRNGARLDVGVTHRRGNFEIRGSGFADSNGDRGGRIGIGFRFKKRSVEWPGDHFNLLIQINPCDFNVYDRNGDGIITKEEIITLFSDGQLADKLFNALDFATGDNQVTFEEFNYIAPHVINGCQKQK